MKKYLVLIILIIAACFTLTAEEFNAFEKHPNALGGSIGTPSKMGIMYQRWAGNIGVRGTFFNTFRFDQSSPVHNVDLSISVDGMFQLYQFSDEFFGANLYLVGGVSGKLVWQTGSTPILGGTAVYGGYGTELLFVQHWGLFVEFLQGLELSHFTTGPAFALGIGYHF